MPKNQQYPRGSYKPEPGKAKRQIKKVKKKVKGIKDSFTKYWTKKRPGTGKKTSKDYLKGVIME